MPIMEFFTRDILFLQENCFFFIKMYLFTNYQIKISLMEHMLLVPQSCFSIV